MIKKRLYELDGDDVREWQKTRMEAGADKYHKIDHKRYNLVDIMEEILDAANILERFWKRMTEQGLGEDLSEQDKAILVQHSNHLYENLGNIIERVVTMDKMLPDEYCTDEEGGDRIWWNDFIKNRLKNPK